MKSSVVCLHWWGHIPSVQFHARSQQFLRKFINSKKTLHSLLQFLFPLLWKLGLAGTTELCIARDDSKINDDNFLLLTLPSPLLYYHQLTTTNTTNFRKKWQINKLLQQVLLLSDSLGCWAHPQEVRGVSVPHPIFCSCGGVTPHCQLHLQLCIHVSTLLMTHSAHEDDVVWTVLLHHGREIPETDSMKLVHCLHYKYQQYAYCWYSINQSINPTAIAPVSLAELSGVAANLVFNNKLHKAVHDINGPSGTLVFLGKRSSKGDEFPDVCWKLLSLIGWMVGRYSHRAGAHERNDLTPVIQGKVASSYTCRLISTSFLIHQTTALHELCTDEVTHQMAPIYWLLHRQNLVSKAEFDPVF